VLVIALGLAYHLSHADPGYSDIAAVAFAAPNGAAEIYNGGQNLLATDEVVTDWIMSPAGIAQVRKAGGTAYFDVSLVNLNDELFPNYGDPYETIAVDSPDPTTAASTMSSLLYVLHRKLAAIQAATGAEQSTWIQIRVIAEPSGPVAQSGSKKRSEAGLLLLAIIFSISVAKILDRYRLRPRDWIRRRRRSANGWGAEHLNPRVD
jgi:hypothetical protein